MSSVCCVSSVGRPFYARSVTMPIWNQHACNGGRGRHPWRTGPRLCMLHKTCYPAWCPPPTLAHSPSVTPAEPRSPTPPSQSLGAGCSSSSLSEVCMAEQWAFYPHETWNVSECSRLGPSLLSEHALCPLFPPRERDRDTESIGGCVNTEGGECGDSESWSAKKVFTKRQVRKRGWAKI